jgi:putative tryptophan/tyrosine transport system substrate-binding protein
MKRRAFIAGLGGAVAWPLVADAQQGERIRRISVLSPNDENDPEARAWLTAFTQGLADLGWREGRNLRMEIRWAGGSLERTREYAKALVDLQPDVIFVDSTPQTAALQQQTSVIPIVFVDVSDPVGSGFVVGLPRPGGNITGFMIFEPAMAGKWLELLREIAPTLKRAAIIFNPDTAPYIESYYLPVVEAGARALKVELISAPVRSDPEIEKAIVSLFREPGGGLVGLPDAFMYDHHWTIISLALQNNVPTVHWVTRFTRDGGLLSYGPDTADLYRRAATYVDRILRGAKPMDLPVQLPVKYHMAVNIKTAKTLGLTVPPSILLRADEVIE